MRTEKRQPANIGPDNPARKPLSARQTDEFYNAAKSMSSRRRELTGRILLDFGLRPTELAHSTETWVKQDKHPRTGELSYYVDVPMGERCTGGNRNAQQGNKTGADLHNTSDPCSVCIDRSYSDKEWVDDEFAEKYPWHPKSVRSYSFRTWCIPKGSAEETAEMWKNFLKPDRQWPVTRPTVGTDVNKIVDRANELAEDDPDLKGIDRNVHTHALRHTFGCRLAAANYNPDVRMRQLRHGSMAMSMYYSEAWGLRHRDSVQEREWEANEDF